MQFLKLKRFSWKKLWHWNWKALS